MAAQTTAQTNAQTTAQSAQTSARTHHPYKGGCARLCVCAADYPRIWPRLDEAERNRRLTAALSRLAAGETLRKVANTWGLSGSSLCRALLAYAPLEWRRALVARAMVRHFDAMDALMADPVNSIARARAWYSRWHLDHAIAKFSEKAIELRGSEFLGQCQACGERSVYAHVERPAHCFSCGWQGDSREYLLALIDVRR